MKRVDARDYVLPTVGSRAPPPDESEFQKRAVQREAAEGEHGGGGVVTASVP